MLENILKNVSEFQIKNQVLQVLNYSPANKNNKYGLCALISIFSDLIKENVNTLFTKSVDTSISCILNEKKYPEELLKLENNNLNSFLLAPLSADTHLFNCIIRKINGNYNFVIVNKGYRITHEMYEQYTVQSLENLNKLCSILGPDNKNISTEQIYNIFKENSSISQPLTYLSSNEQKVGNCYFKETETALKYAYMSAYNINFSTPKWPISTEKIHQKYLLEVSKLYPGLSEYISNLSQIYADNKLFRELIKSNMNTFTAFKIAFNHTGLKYPSYIEISDALKRVDLQSLTSHSDFFKNLCLTFGLFEHQLGLSMLDNYIFEKNLGFELISQMVEPFFPATVEQLSLSYSLYYSELYKSIEPTSDLYNYTAHYLLSASLSLDPNNLHSYINRAYVYSMQQQYSLAIEDYNNALKLEPSNIELLLLRGLCYSINSDYSNALIDFGEILKSVPNDQNIINTLVSFSRGIDIEKFIKENEYIYSKSDNKYIKNLLISAYSLKALESSTNNNSFSSLLYSNKILKLENNHPFAKSIEKKYLSNKLNKKQISKDLPSLKM